MLRTAALLAALSLALSGCSAVTGRPFSEWSDDKTLQASVKARLVALSFRNLSRINVDIHDGVVYLSGSVRTPEGKARIEAAAQSVDGVRRVVSHLVPRRGVQEEIGPSALPRAVVTAPVPAPLVGVARLEGTRAYDGADRLVATVYSVPMSELAHNSAERFVAPRPVSHVTIHAMDATAELPLPHYLVVLWHAPDTKTPSR